MFLKGSKKSKEKLEKEEPNLFNYFKTVWDFKERHEIPSLPEQYLFGLVCCFNRNYLHPVYQSGKEGTHLEWYPRGPKLGYIPLPIYQIQNMNGETNPVTVVVKSFVLDTSYLQMKF